MSEGCIESNFINEQGDWLSLTFDSVDVNKAISHVSDNGAGAISTFIGTTRDNFEGKNVTHLEYDAYSDMAIQSMNEVCKQMREKWHLTRIAIQHKLGSCPIGHISIIIAVSSEHRKESLDAVAFAINTLKAIVPIWKKEMYDDKSETWKENKEYQPQYQSQNDKESS